MAAASSTTGTRSRWTVHMCAMTEDQHPFEQALRTWLAGNGHRLTEVDGLPLLARLEVVRTADLCLVLLGPTFGACDPLSSFSYAELEAAAAADAHPGKLLVFAQAGVDEPTSPEQREFIERLRNFAGGTFQATCETPEKLVRQVESALTVWQPPQPRGQAQAAEPPRGALMISSTGDLVAERTAIHEVLDAEGFPVIDYLRAASETVAPIERITSWASGCAALVLVLGSRYGYISPVDGLGITELEFVTALRAGRPVLAFARADAEASPDADERQFVERVRAFVPPQQLFPFSDLDMLRGCLREALGLLHAGQTQPCSMEAPRADARRWYRRQIQRWLGRMPHLTRPEGMPLEALYISLHQAKDEVLTQRAAKPQYIGDRPNAQHLLQRDAISPDEALQSFTRLVLRGEPGAGKSVTLHWYALKAPEDVTPVLIRLGTYARMRAAGQVADLLEAVAREERRLVLAPGAHESAWRTALESGRGLVLLDGLDQVPRDQQEVIATDIRLLARHLPETGHIVVATRAAGYDGQLDGTFSVMDVLPPDLEQRRRLILDVVRSAHDDTHASREAAERRAGLAIALTAQQGIADWASTPLMLTLLAVLADAAGIDLAELPKSRAEILWRVGRLILGRWKTLNQAGGRWHLVEKERLLLAIAREETLKGQEGSLTSARIEALWATAPSTLRQTPAEELLRELSDQAGLLSQQDDNTYAFRYPVFSAYLAARLASAWPPATRQEQVARGRLSGRWDATAQLLVSELDRLKRHQEADAVVETLRLADRQPVSGGGARDAIDPFHVSLVRAATCEGARTAVYAGNEVAQRVAEDLMRVWHSWEGRQIPTAERMRAINPLADLGRVLLPMTDELIELATGADSIPKSAAIRALGTLAAAGEPRAAEVMRQLNEKVRGSEGHDYSPTRGVEELGRMLGDANISIRQHAALRLSFIGPAAAPAVPELRAAIRDIDRGVAATALRALAAIGPAAGTAAPDVLRLAVGADAQQTDGAYLATTALTTLAAIGPGAMGISDALLEKAFSARDSVRVRYMSDALGQIGLTSAGREMFERALDDATDAQRRKRAYDLLRALYRFVPVDWRRIFTVVFTYTVDAPSVYAREVLLHLPPTETAEVVDALREVLRSGDWRSRADACSLLAEIGPAARPAVPEMEAIVRDRESPINRAVYFWALLALAAFTPEARRMLVDETRPKLHDANEATRAGAVRNLSRAGAEAVAVMPDLRALLHDSSAMVRKEVADVLKAIGPAAAPAVDDLRQMLRDPDVWLRATAAQALAAIGPAAAPALGDLDRILDETDAVTHGWVGSALRTLLNSIEDAAYVPMPMPTPPGG